MSNSTIKLCSKNKKKIIYYCIYKKKTLILQAK